MVGEKVQVTPWWVVTSDCMWLNGLALLTFDSRGVASSTSSELGSGCFWEGSAHVENKVSSPYSSSIEVDLQLTLSMWMLHQV